MGSGLKWFRVACDMHSNAKISSLTDAEFRVLTFLWSLAQRSSDPGLVQHVDPYRVVASSGAKHCGCCGGPDEQSPLQIFEHLAALGLIEHDGDTVRVHDWLEHNPAAYPSLKPEARAAQKRKERAKLADVAKMSQATYPDVARVDQIRSDKDQKEKEQKHAQSDAAHPPAPVSEFQQFVIKHWPDVKEPAEREAEWRDACPGVDLLAESKKALSWENETPRHRKTDHGKFLGNWFRRAQDNGSRAGLQTFDQKRQQDRVEVFGSLLKGAQNGVDAGGAQPDRIGPGDHNGTHGRDVQQRDGAVLPARARVVPG